MLITYFLLHMFVGLYLTFSTPSRGFWPDLLFSFFWPLYWLDDWRKGRL